MIKHWVKLSCLVLCSQLIATACTTENDDDDSSNGGAGGTEASGGTTASGGTEASGGTASGTTASGGTNATGGSAGEGPTTTTSNTTASGGTASGGSAGEAGAGNTGNGGSAGASTDGYDGGQITEISGPESVTNGGTFTIQVTIPGADGDQDFQVVVGDGDAVTTNATPDDAGVFGISVTIPDDATGDTVTIAVSPVDGDGDVGDPMSIDPELIETGSGDVKVTLSFDQDADLDLFVMEPDGTVINSENASESGGQLDLDSNRFCDPIDGINIENIFWPTGGAPEGEYAVGVKYYGACEVTETVNFTITITIGDDVETVTGSFEPEEAGEDTDVITVTEFTVD